MTTFDSREKGFETKFALDEESRFKAEARACKKLGLWAAERFNLIGDDAEMYAKSVVASNLDEPGFDDVIARVDADFKARNITIDRHEIASLVDQLFDEAISDMKA